MKKLLTLALAAAMMAGAAQFALAAEDDGASSIMAQINAFKATNQEKTGEAVSEDKAEAQAPAPEAAQEQEEAAAPEQAAQPAQQAETPAAPNPASAAVDQIVREAAQQAAQESGDAGNNRGVVAIPAQDAQDEVADESAPEPQPTAPEAQPAAETPAKPATVQIPAQSISTAPSAPAATAEVPAGRPLNPTAMQAGAPETRESLLVSADWLKANVKNVVLIDARPESLYLGGHIPGAVNAPWTYFANMNAKQGTDKWGTIWPEATMAKRIGALGINGKKTVVAYCDAGGWGQSGWTLWILRQAGIKNAKILEGGIGAWKAAGGQLAKNKVKAKTVAFTIKKYVPNYTATTQWINDNLGKPGLAIIDVRTQPEYNGKIRPFQEKRAGHLPGAVNISRENFVTEQGHFKSAEEVAALLAPYGITTDTEIVVYDTAGVRSAFITMLLRYAGFTKSQSYDSGFQAWAGNPDLPLVKP